MELLEKALIISLYCVGLRIISSKGMILYFLRKPYEWINTRRDAAEMFKDEKDWKAGKIETLFYEVGTYVLKPLIGCVVCMGSFWTIIIELTYFNLSLSTLLLIFIVCAMNGIIYGMYELISAMIKHYTKTS